MDARGKFELELDEDQHELTILKQHMEQLRLDFDLEAPPPPAPPQPAATEPSSPSSCDDSSSDCSGVGSGHDRRGGECDGDGEACSDHRLQNVGREGENENVTISRRERATAVAQTQTPTSTASSSAALCRRHASIRERQNLDSQRHLSQRSSAGRSFNNQRRVVVVVGESNQGAIPKSNWSGSPRREEERSRPTTPFAENRREDGARVSAAPSPSMTRSALPSSINSSPQGAKTVPSFPAISKRVDDDAAAAAASPARVVGRNPDVYDAEEADSDDDAVVHASEAERILGGGGDENSFSSSSIPVPRVTGFKPGVRRDQSFFTTTGSSSSSAESSPSVSPPPSDSEDSSPSHLLEDVGNHSEDGIDYDDDEVAGARSRLHSIRENVYSFVETRMDGVVPSATIQTKFPMDAAASTALTTRSSGVIIVDDVSSSSSHDVQSDGSSSDCSLATTRSSEGCLVNSTSSSLSSIADSSSLIMEPEVYSGAVSVVCPAQPIASPRHNAFRPHQPFDRHRLTDRSPAARGKDRRYYTTDDQIRDAASSPAKGPSDVGTSFESPVKGSHRNGGSPIGGGTRGAEAPSPRREGPGRHIISPNPSSRRNAGDSSPERSCGAGNSRGSSRGSPTPAVVQALKDVTNLLDLTPELAHQRGAIIPSVPNATSAAGGRPIFPYRQLHPTLLPVHFDPTVNVVYRAPTQAQYFHHPQQYQQHHHQQPPPQHPVHYPFLGPPFVTLPLAQPPPPPPPHSSYHHHHHNHHPNHHPNHHLGAQHRPIFPGQPVSVQQQAIITMGPAMSPGAKHMYPPPPPPISLPPPPAPHVHAQPQSEKKDRCAFCKSNGERESVFMSHCLRDPESRAVVCPQLRKFVCPICSATGDHAHTQSYCPKNTSSFNRSHQNRTVKHLKGRNKKIAISQLK